MAREYKKTTVVRTDPEDGCVRMFHGSRLEMIDRIAEVGINIEQIKYHGGGNAFFTSKHLYDAEYYSNMPPLTGAPAILAFDVSEDFMERCLRHPSGSWALEHFNGHFEFFEPSHDELNRQMTTIEVSVNVKWEEA